MATVWKLLPTDGDESVVIADPIPGQCDAGIGGADSISELSTRVRLLQVDRYGRREREVDFPWWFAFGGPVLALRPRAMAAIGDLLRGYGELIPLDCDEADLTAFVCRRMIDALDLEHSAIDWFADGERIMWIDRYAFRPDRVQGQALFCLTQFPAGGGLFAGEEFKMAVEAAGLRGLAFNPVWSEEDAEEGDGDGG